VSLKAQEVVLSTLHHTQKVSPADALKESMEEACRLLSSELNTTIFLKDVADTINMSYENFRKQFRKFTGNSPA
jgi:AraC family transcriptional regulator, arabinose operon regulatory protein